jgi:hypothetical protein
MSKDTDNTARVGGVAKMLGIWFKPYSVTFSGKLPETDDERPQIFDISYVLLGKLIQAHIDTVCREAFESGLQTGHAAEYETQTRLNPNKDTGGKEQ